MPSKKVEKNIVDERVLAGSKTTKKTTKVVKGDPKLKTERKQ